MLSESDRAQQRAAANERYGHKNYMWVLFGRPLAKVAVLPVAVLIGAAWLIRTVDRTQVSFMLGGFGLLLLFGYGVWFVKTGTARAQMMARARGKQPSPRWHLVGAAGVLLTVAAFALHSAP